MAALQAGKLDGRSSGGFSSLAKSYLECLSRIETVANWMRLKISRRNIPIEPADAVASVSRQKALNCFRVTSFRRREYSTDSWWEIQAQVCVFRSKLPVIPLESFQLFRAKSSTRFTRSLPAIPRESFHPFGA